MKDDKEEPLNLKKLLSKSSRNKKRINSMRIRKKSSNKFIEIIIIIIFIILIFLFGYLIYKKLNKLEEVKISIIRKNKEIEYENKIKIELKEKIKNINKELDEKEKNVINIKNLHEEKKSEFDIKKKIYENLNDLYNSNKKENFISNSLDEAIKNLNERINNTNNKKQLIFFIKVIKLIYNIKYINKFYYGYFLIFA